ncbi:hypothetical protein Csa_009891 [Cucumis sativus]|uniref:Uncharacterized protein n=1 Tax=Cucumis sativus TaxID=3659 RepID=A0A0A0LA31_CUCSA|nr:hypothetical protein Csa_009891 [Cucumis sativus]
MAMRSEGEDVKIKSTELKYTRIQWLQKFSPFFSILGNITFTKTNEISEEAARENSTIV